MRYTVQHAYSPNVLLFFKLQLKKTISECRKYNFFLAILSLHFHICTVVKEQGIYRDLNSGGEGTLAFWGQDMTLPPPPTKDKQKQKVKPNQRIKNATTRVTTNSSVHYSELRSRRQS